MAMDTPNLLPDFIRFLFSNKPKFDCVFQVGNVSHGKPERIGAVKIMLMAHSEVFRLELEDSELKDKENVAIPDIHPDTFKGMLKYVYGHDTTADMCFDEADNLLYVAEKYMMKTFKNKLAARLIILLNPDNICSLLNNPACYTHLQLDAAITEILRYETDHVLESPQFLWMNRDGFLKILQQDGLAVEEIDLWRAAVKWAKHRADTEDGLQLRGELTGITQHIRICTFTPNQILTEVATTNILTATEIGNVIISLGQQRKPQNLCEFSDEIQPRNILLRKRKERKELYMFNKPDILSRITENFSSGTYNMTIQTKQCGVELLSLGGLRRVFETFNHKYSTQVLEESGYDIVFTTTITKLADPHNTSNSTLCSTTISSNSKRGFNFNIRLFFGRRNIILQPNTKYSVQIQVYGDYQLQYTERNCNSSFSDDYLELIISDDNKCLHFPFLKLQYEVVIEESS